MIESEYFWTCLSLRTSGNPWQIALGNLLMLSDHPMRSLLLVTFAPQIEPHVKNGAQIALAAKRAEEAA